MKRSRLRLVHKRKPKVEDLSFLPPYSEQAKYIDLANNFLAPNEFGYSGEGDVLPIDQSSKPRSENKKIG